MVASQASDASKVLGRRAQEAGARASETLAGPALAEAIRLSRLQVIAGGTRPVGSRVEKALTPYFDRTLLHQANWARAGRGIDLGSLVAGWYYAEGAVTLDDTIVFSDEDLTRNLWLWAHELAHVEQYKQLGIDGFAAAYVSDWRTLEAQANKRAFAVTADIRRRAEVEEAQEETAARESPVAAVKEWFEEVSGSDEDVDVPEEQAE